MARVAREGAMRRVGERTIVMNWRNEGEKVSVTSLSLGCGDAGWALAVVIRMWWSRNGVAAAQKLPHISACMAPLHG